ncbi:diguanylate cyclase domain-containing protein [Vreelandella aquamarina]
MIEPNIPHRLMTATYSLSFLLLAAYTAWLYAMGQYDMFFLPAFLELLLVSALLMHVGRGVNPLAPRIILLCCVYLVVFQAVIQPSGHASALWLGLPITASFVLLPLTPVLIINLLLAPLLLWLAPVTHSSPAWLPELVALFLLLALPRWEHLRRQALLRATDPNDSDCDAYQTESLQERLRNEYQRSYILGRRLAVLVIHLPQFDMAGEQFGRRAQLALLERLCSEVHLRCRDHDLLGRADQATFWLVLPDTTESGALLVRERLQRGLSRCVLVETGQLDARIVACLPRHRELFNVFVQRLEERSQTLANPVFDTPE